MALFALILQVFVSFHVFILHESVDLLLFFLLDLLLLLDEFSLLFVFEIEWFVVFDFNIARKVVVIELESWTAAHDLALVVDLVP